MATSTASSSSGTQSATSSSNQLVSEYVVRTPKSNKKRFNVMRFTTSTGIDVTKFGQTSMKMERENNQKDRIPDEEMAKFGAGSEFGREAREEARKKRYGGKKNYKAEDQPWVLKIGGKTGRKYKGVKGGGITENASYYIFMKAPDGAFEAFPVEEWFNFAPIQRYKALSAEEAEEEFGRREKVMNYFSIMLKKRLTLDEKGGEPAEGEEKTTEKKGKKKGAKADLKLTDMDEWLSDSDNESNEGSEKSGDEDDAKKKKNQKAKKGKAKKGGKKKNKKGSDEEALEESDEGDFDDREVDYMSDSSTSSEEAPEEKMNKQMKGVEDEEALMKLNVSDEEEEEPKEGQAEGEKKEGAAAEETPNNEEKKPDPKAVKAKVEKKGSSGDSSADTSDSDFDDCKFQSAMFMQKAKKRGTDSTGSSRANTPTKANSSKSSKRKQAVIDGSSTLMGAPSSKKLKQEASNASNISGSPSEGISEDAVRRYLMRKPMTTTELLQKFKSKRIGISGDQLVTTIAQILKKLNPEKQTIKGKLYLSIKA